jgi:hypothetical protein
MTECRNDQKEMDRDNGRLAVHDRWLFVQRSHETSLLAGPLDPPALSTRVLDPLDPLSLNAPRLDNPTRPNHDPTAVPCCSVAILPLIRLHPHMTSNVEI